jgi:hypothetical protein
MTIATIVSAILQQMPKVTKWQKKFIVHILPLFMGIRGKVNMKQMSRYGSYNETTYHNQLKKPFDYLQFNPELIAQHGSGQYLLVFDPSYLPKSGKKKPNVGSFWSGYAGAMRSGLELVVSQIRFGEKKNLRREINFKKEIFLQKNLFFKIYLSPPPLAARTFPKTLFVEAVVR